MIRYLGYLKHGSKLYFCFPDSLESSGIDFILHSYFVSHHHPFRCHENIKIQIVYEFLNRHFFWEILRLKMFKQRKIVTTSNHTLRSPQK